MEWEGRGWKGKGGKRKWKEGKNSFSLSKPTVPKAAIAPLAPGVHSTILCNSCTVFSSRSYIHYLLPRQSTDQYW